MQETELPLCHPPPSPTLFSSAFSGFHRLWPFTVSHRRPCLSPLVSLPKPLLSLSVPVGTRELLAFIMAVSGPCLSLTTHSSPWFFFIFLSECWPVVWFAFKSVFLHFPSVLPCVSWWCGIEYLEGWSSDTPVTGTPPSACPAPALHSRDGAQGFQSSPMELCCCSFFCRPSPSLTPQPQVNNLLPDNLTRSVNRKDTTFTYLVCAMTVV